MANEITEQEEVKCSFCGKPQSQVKKLWLEMESTFVMNVSIFPRKLLMMN